MTTLVHDEVPATIRIRAAALTTYLLAVRSQMERPARTITGEAVWQHRLPQHPQCDLGVADDGSSWLRVGRPPAPPAPPVARLVASLLVAPVSADQEPQFDTPDDTPDDEVGGLRVAFEQWREHEWRPWAEQAQRTQSTRALHQQLSDLRHRVDMFAATEELVWGHGTVHLQIGAHRVAYPLVVTPVALDYDPDRAIISVSPAGPTRLQTDALSGITDEHLRQLLALGTGGLVTVDLWDDLERRELFERALRRLGFDPVLRDTDASAPGGPHIHDTGVLFVRPRQRMLRRFLELLRDRLQGGDIDSVGALASILAHEPSRLQMPGDQPESWRPVGGRLLMPLPTNEAQESIARRLAGNRNVAVQGPPGTGKTHTIRNLICHLMAHGKRVLVLAQKEDPLRVLRDGLPDEVKALCLAVLGRSADQLVQLQLAARELSDRAVTLDQVAEQRRIDRLTAQLEETERELGRALAALRSIAESESATYRIDGALLGPADVGAWLVAREPAYGDIPDAVDADVDAPLDADGFVHLLRLATTVSAADRVEARKHLPPVAELPQAALVRAERARLAQLDAVLGELRDAGVDLTAVRATGLEAFADLNRRLHDTVGLLRRREGAWTDRLGRQLADPRWQVQWSTHVDACLDALHRLAQYTGDIGGHRITVPEHLSAHPKQLQADLAELRQRLAAGKSVNRLFHSTLAKVAAECQVDDEPLRTTADIDVVVAHVARLQLRAQLAGRWTEWAEWLAIPTQELRGAPELWAGTLIEQARVAVRWDSEEWPGLYAALRQLLPQLEPRADSATLDAAATLLLRAPVVFEHDRLATGQRSGAAALHQGLSQADASELWRSLEHAWQDPDLTRWDDTCAEVRRLVMLRTDAVAYVDLLDRLARVAPQWAGQIDAGTATALHGTGADCLQRWRWRQAQTWFDRVIGDLDAEVLGRRVEKARGHIRGLTRELVVASAWLAVSRALDDRRRAALADWATSLRKIGKGTGKKASHWQAEAQRAMAEAVHAVPVWVMSIDRAIEQFAGGAQFDVVIVDEASQADMFSLPILSLAERAVVVGDDQQIGPQLSFVGDVQGLIDGHLADVPSANQFDPEGSLYDHAVRRSDRILLTEHFRCVPQIIDFSSINYYDGRIEPLRTDRPAGIGEPVRAVHVPEGIRQTLTSYGEVNVAEADLLVQQVEAITTDPEYDGKTVGVISLLSTSGQGQYLLHRLQQAIGLDEMERRRLRVGDSYTFQGDERDVVLLSLVAATNDGRIAAFTKRDYHRRINVAASRARDQLWVFHSFQPSDVPADDARGKLLSYCQNVHTATDSYNDLELRCDSDFERAVLKRMLVRGLRPLPQFKIGSYRIDFVLPMADGRRLAVECDGDAYHGPDEWEADIRRQALLERVGNCVFVRIRGSLFSRDPDRALQPLWQRIEELGEVQPAAPREPDSAIAVAVPPPDASEVRVPVEAGQNAAHAVHEPAVDDPAAREDEPRTPTAAAAEDIDDQQSSRWVDVPDGYRSVAWVRPEEAHAALHAYATKKDAPIRTGGKATGWARYYADESENARKFRANVMLERMSPSGTRFVCWLREPEASAIVQAAARRAGVPVGERGGGWVGHVEYYPPDSEEARRFRSPTRLLRVRGRGQQ